MKIQFSKKMRIAIASLSIALPLSLAQAADTVVNQLLQSYATQGAKNADMNQGRKMWQQVFKRNGESVSRSCTSCHTSDLKAVGKHVKTSKAIQPMSPVVNPERLSDRKKIEKWFKRNCKWTMNRECSAQEKSDFLVYINNTMNF